MKFLFMHSNPLKFFLTLCFCLLFGQIKAQILTQTIRGIIRDNISEVPLAGANVIVQEIVPLRGATSDENGFFKIHDIPVGTQSLRISYVGYKELLVPNVVVNSGKEVVLNLVMEENIELFGEIVVTPSEELDKPINEMSVVSARTFSVEETQKYAAAVNDPSRMASSFSGVLSTDDGSNQISIRGNSPNGLLYKMEGVEIPDPNHFSGVGAVGGGISVLSSQLLSNSDFITGAFASEYGNALSGVFDLKLRKGNNEKQEYTFQAGLLGVDISSEGPFKKGYNGSYLVNYRYSTLGILSTLGVNVGSGKSIFQDLSFNIFLPAKKAGIFTVFGFGGLSSSIEEAKKDSLKWESRYDRYNSFFYSDKGAVGLTHTYFMTTKTFLKTIFLQSGTALRYGEEILDDNYVPRNNGQQSFYLDKSTLTSTLNHKVNAQHSFRLGIIINQMTYQLRFAMAVPPSPVIQEQIKTKDNTQTIQAFGQWNFNVTDKLTLNSGVHFMELLMNQSFSLEPRTSLKYSLNEKQSFSFGYGLHSQIQPLGVYFAQYFMPDGTVTTPNSNLGLSKAYHYVIGYDRMLSKQVHIKLELYDQDLFNIPVSPDIKSTLCILNNQYGFITDSLVNKGRGRNKGMELTLEKFLSNGYYFLLSSSLYDSKYKSLDKVWRNTRFNGNYTFALTSGKEIQLSEKHKKRIIGMNIKVLYSGGLRSTPIDLMSSSAKGETVYYEDKAFTGKNPDYFRTDIRVSMKRNKPKSTGTISLDVQNITNRKNFGGEYFDPSSGKTKTYTQTPLIPVLSYRLEF